MIGRFLRVIAPLLALAGGAHAQQTSWPERFYNPAPLENDLVLPLPCGGAMAFRPVATPPIGGDALSDRSILLGWANQPTGHIDYLHREHILGSLQDPATGEWLFYIGKYEVTQDQWAAVMQTECPTPGMAGMRPKTSISWFDAVDFTRRLSEWLLAQHQDSLPQAGRYRAYLRLPTEAEWEYAARGGAAVSEAQFRERLFPMEGELNTYVWYQGPDSAQGSIKPVGVRDANPLGLHDVLGNVEEFVLEPFRLNRVGRPHGEAGGFVTRGGSILTPAEEIRTALRNEYGYFNIEGGQPLALDTFGIRPVLSAPVGSSDDRARAVSEAWQAEASSPRGTTGDALAVLAELEERSTDLDLKASLGAIQELVASERRARNDVEARAVRQSILSGTIFIFRLQQDIRIAELAAQQVADVEAQLDQARGQGDTAAIETLEERLAQRRQVADNAEERVDLLTRGFTNIVFALVDDYSTAQLREQSDLLGRELRLAEQAALVDHVRRFDEVLRAYRADPSIGTAGLVDVVMGRAAR
ncbi:MAG TPA: SUMF1/EgtB/PvdO family nonheme iron enzyme [Geminicoccaceae bacterium]|nr:SUMF1/EgtB/PvdO family nonheme iron enzyme [Geminicoccaceae bacterium]